MNTRRKKRINPVSSVSSKWKKKQFDDGEIYVVNYIVDDAPKAQIRGYSLTVDDFILPGSGTSPWEMSVH